MNLVLFVWTLTSVCQAMIATKTQLASTQKAFILAYAIQATLVTAKLVKKAVVKMTNVL